MRHVKKIGLNLQEVIQTLDHIWLFKTTKTLHRVNSGMIQGVTYYTVEWFENDSQIIEGQ